MRKKIINTNAILNIDKDTGDGVLYEGDITVIIKEKKELSDAIKGLKYNSCVVPYKELISCIEPHLCERIIAKYEANVEMNSGRVLISDNDAMYELGVKKDSFCHARRLLVKRGYLIRKNGELYLNPLISWYGDADARSIRYKELGSKGITFCGEDFQPKIPKEVIARILRDIKRNDK